jgi:DNA-binding response OmpR family regulator
MKKILVVDDEKSFLDIIKDAFEIRGYQVITATNAVEAGLELADKKPELILMDIKMPGINGLQACDAIHRNPLTKNIPIIIISALSDETDIKRACKYGITDYMVKPVDMDRLVKRVKEVLGE